MEKLIEIRKSGKTGNPVVNARDLHSILGAKQDFSNWFKSRIKKNMLIENVDYARILYDINGKKIQLAKNSESDNEEFKRVYRIEYAITLDCAKGLAMVQSNEKGRQVREYFIEVDKKYRELKEKSLKEPDLLYTMTETANLLNLSDFYGKIGRNSLYNILYHHKIVDEKNRAIVKYVKKGYFTNYPTKVTEKGLNWLNQRFSVEKTGDTGNVTELKKLIDDLKKKQEIQENNQTLMIEGVKCVVETLYFNKGGKKTEEQNRMAINDLQMFLEKVKTMPKALN